MSEMNENEIKNEITLIQAIAECYAFNPRKKKGSRICFEIHFPGEEGTVKFGKSWGKFPNGWHYFEKSGKYVPALRCEEKHFVSNIFCDRKMQQHMIYAAQQGQYTITKTITIGGIVV